ncbi:MAG: hypothetical protein K2L09_04255, partial [Alistipes sp.]|nr:hypothetical protein [Alistipes sp.]
IERASSPRELPENHPDKIPERSPEIALSEPLVRPDPQNWRKNVENSRIFLYVIAIIALSLRHEIFGYFLSPFGQVETPVVVRYAGDASPTVELSGGGIR